jgi:hypothetical protein
MNNEVHQHPDGHIYVRTPHGIYQASAAEFEADVGQPFPPLPEGAEERIYTQGVRHAVMATGPGMLHGDVMPWPYGDDLINRIDDLLAKHTERHAARDRERIATRNAMPVTAIMRDQFFAQLATAGFITEAEALAALATGAIPSAIETVIQTMQATRQFRARTLMTGAPIINRTDQIVVEFLRAQGVTGPAAVAKFWKDASKL